MSPLTGKLRVGFIGLGAMGASMARNLAAGGLLASVWNRSPAKAAALAAETGCQAARGPAELAAQVDVVVICVSADQDVREVVAAMAGGLRRDQVVIDCSTINRQTEQSIGQALAAQGVAYLDAPVSGGVEGARNGTLSFMVGGDEAVFARVQPVFAAMGKRIVHMGPVGAGQATKAVNQVMCAGINQAVTEALAFAAALKLPLERVIDVVGSGAAGNWFLSHRGANMMRGEFPPGFKLGLHHKDLKICEAMAEAAGAALPLSAQTVTDYAALMRQGFGDEDISALYRLKMPSQK